MFDSEDDDEEIPPQEQIDAVVRFAGSTVSKLFHTIIKDKRFTVPYTDLLGCAAVVAFRHLLYDFLMLNVSMNIKTHPYVLRCINLGEAAEDILSDHLSQVCGDVVDDLTTNLPMFYVPFIEDCVERVVNRFDELEKNYEAE